MDKRITFESSKQEILDIIKEKELDEEDLWNISEEHWEDLDFGLSILRRQPEALKFVPEEYNNVLFCRTAFMADAKTFEYVPSDLWQQLVTYIACTSPSMIKDLPDALQHNKMLALMAVTADGSSLKHLSPELRADRQVVRFAIENNALALEYASDSLKDDMGIVLTAVSANGHALQFASERLRETPEVIQIANTSLVLENGKAIKASPEKEFAEKTNIGRAAMKGEGDLLEYLDMVKQTNDRENTVGDISKGR